MGKSFHFSGSHMRSGTAGLYKRGFWSDSSSSILISSAWRFLLTHILNNIPYYVAFWLHHPTGYMVASCSSDLYFLGVFLYTFWSLICLLWKKYPLKFFYTFSNCLLVIQLWEFFVFSRYHSYVWYMTCKYFHPFCWLSFHLMVSKVVQSFKF